MNDRTSDDLDEVKVFFQQYGRFLFYGVLALVIVVGGGFYYRHYTAQRRFLAGALYNEMMNAASQNRMGLASVAGHKLEQSFRSTPYAGQAALLLARLDYQQNHTPAAIADLKFAIHHGSQWMVKTVARLRLGGLLLATGHPHQAWHYAHIAKPYGFHAMALGLQAEILAREGHKVQAYHHFAAALQHAPKKSALTTLWRREQAQLGVVS